MKRVLIEFPDGIVLRDGTPFGGDGQIFAGFHALPAPQTVAGCIRTAIGLNRDREYFSEQNDDNINSIMNVGIERVLFTISSETGTEHIWPVPADLFIKDSDSEAEYQALMPELKQVKDFGGTDLADPEWLVPVYPTMEKPSSNPPAFLSDDELLQWMNASAGDEISISGINMPVCDTRIQTSISRESGTSEYGRLFSVTTNSMQSVAGDGKTAGLGVSLRLDDTAAMDLPEQGYLGGERHPAVFSITDESDNFMPPPVFQNSGWLKIMLTSPGDFEKWCPEWMMPQESGAAAVIPGTDIRVVLRSAFVSRYLSVSGWDYRTRRPKASRRFVPAGSVYILQLEDASETAFAAETLFGNSLCMEKTGKKQQAALNGYGGCIVTTPQIKF